MTVTTATRTSPVLMILRAGFTAAIVAALLVAGQAGTLARERDEMPEDPRRQEMPAERPDEDRREDPRRDNGTNLNDDPADNGTGLKDDPADNGNKLTEVELEPIYMD